MKTIKKQFKVYEFDELSENSKEKAIKDFREHNLDYEWYDGIFEDIKTIGNIIGINIDNIYFSGFWSQGDGACFEGSYKYNKGSVKKIKGYAPLDTKLHEIALSLSKLQRRYFYKLYAKIKHQGRYSHEYSTQISVYDECGYGMPHDVDDELSDILRDFMRWIYKNLETEYNYLQSDEAIEETIKINEYQFLKDGSFYY